MSKWTCPHAPSNIHSLLHLLPACVIKQSIAPFLLFTKPNDHTLVVFGGRSSGLGNTEGHLQSVCALVADEWTPLPDMPAARVGAAAVFSHNQFIVTGGYTDTAPLRDAIALDITDMTWRHFATMSGGRYGHASVVVNDFMYVLGGESTGHPGTCERVHLAGLENNFESIPPLPLAVAGCRAAAAGRNIFVVGGVVLGWGVRRASDAVQVFDIDKQTWSLFPTRLKVGRAAFALHHRHSQLLLSGGFAVVDGVEQELSSAESLAVTLDASTHASLSLDLPSPRGGCQSAKLSDGAFVVIGGEAPNAKTVKGDCLSLKVTTVPCLWQKGKPPTMNTPRTALAVCVGKLWPPAYHTATVFTKFDF